MPINPRSLMSTIAVSLTLNLLSCKPSPELNSPDPSQYFKASYTGFDISGHAKSCLQSPVDKCPKKASPQQEYAADCTAHGYTAYQCDCDTYLCSNSLAKNTKPDENSAAIAKGAKSFSGYDLKGNKRTCQAMPPDTFCTESFEAADQFAIDCRKQGYTYFQCACHDYICSEKLTPK